MSYGGTCSPSIKIMKREIVNCRGLKCPMPIVKTRLALKPLKKDDEVVIFADDPNFQSEFDRFCYLADISLILKTEKMDGDDKVQIYHVKVLK